MRSPSSISPHSLEQLAICLAIFLCSEWGMLAITVLLLVRRWRNVERRVVNVEGGECGIVSAQRKRRNETL